MLKSTPPPVVKAETPRCDLFSLAMVVGLLTFFVTGDAEGGLSDVQGFALGFAVVFIGGLAILWAAARAEQGEPLPLCNLETRGISISQSRDVSDRGVTIHIHVSEAALFSSPRK